MSEELPIHISLLVQLVIQAEPWMLKGADCVDQCCTASQTLQRAIHRYTDEEAKVVGTYYHVWVECDGYCIDLTARQFDESLPCPRVWRAGSEEDKAMYEKHSVELQTVKTDL